MHLSRRKRGRDRSKSARPDFVLKYICSFVLFVHAVAVLSLREFLFKVDQKQERKREKNRKKKKVSSTSSMKVIGYLLLCVLPMIFLIQVTSATEERIKLKRPFCNAFTGCGKKRSLYGTAIYFPYFVIPNGIKLPIHIYKILIKSSEEIKMAVSRDSNNY